MSGLSDFKEEMKKRTKVFAHQCVKFAVNLPQDQLGNHIRGQLIRAGTSVASNYRASCIAQSVPVIISKLSISIEEADESEFWLEFAMVENLCDNAGTEPLLREAHEIASILIKGRHTLQSKR